MLVQLCLQKCFILWSTYLFDIATAQHSGTALRRKRFRQDLSPLSSSFLHSCCCLFSSAFPGRKIEESVKPPPPPPFTSQEGLPTPLGFSSSSSSSLLLQFSPLFLGGPQSKGFPGQKNAKEERGDTPSSLKLHCWEQKCKIRREEGGEGPSNLKKEHPPNAAYAQGQIHFMQIYLRGSLPAGRGWLHSERDEESSSLSIEVLFLSKKDPISFLERGDFLGGSFLTAVAVASSQWRSGGWRGENWLMAPHEGVAASQRQWGREGREKPCATLLGLQVIPSY